MSVRKTRPPTLPEQLDEIAGNFAQKATLLSDALARAEHVFSSLSAKVSVSIDTDKGNTLEFCKSQTGEWRLHIEERNSEGNWIPKLVTQANLELKALAARHLPALYRELCSAIENRANSLDDGLAELSTLPFLNVPPEYGRIASPAPNDEGGIPDDEIPF